MLQNMISVAYAVCFLHPY
jgi:hypothetical protein